MTPHNTFTEKIINFIKLSDNPTVFLNYFIHLMKVILEHGNVRDLLRSAVAYQKFKTVSVWMGEWWQRGSKYK
jgi:Ca2+-binding EF-hand superfamily protein